MSSRSIILGALARPLQAVLLIYSVVLLASGHDTPGGGFVGGLTAAAAFVLQGVAFGFATARRSLRVAPRTLLAAGLLLALASGVPGLLRGGAYQTPAWVSGAFGLPFGLGTPFLFDLGVYVAVVGAALALAFTLAET